MEQKEGPGVKKLFISADMEGTCGASTWDDVTKGKTDYQKFAERMSREVGAACEGALEGGMDFVMVRDAHDSARNIDWSFLPKQVQLMRGWGQDPLCMMTGIDESYHGAVFTGYHDAAGSGESPLAHTMSLGISWISLNGEPLSEAQINAYTAARHQVPLLAISGDSGICGKMRLMIPALKTVEVNRGTGNLVLSIHPEKALSQIREAVKQACSEPREDYLLKLPDSFRLDVRFRDHAKAYQSGFYRGVKRLDAHTLRYEAEDWYEVLRMMHFCL